VLKIFYPQYIYIVQKTAGEWRFREPSKIIYRGTSEIDLSHRETHYRLTLKQIIIELFKINGGKLGFYLADMKHEKYYYCGTQLDDVREKLISIGVISGR
jgi:hypothetical protein